MKRFSCKATAVLTAVFFISSGIFVPTSFASVNELTSNETQRPVPTLTLEQANAQTTPVTENEIPSGVAVQNENPLSLATLSLQTEGDVAPEGAIQVHEGESIQAAINQAQAGDIVYVHAGTYHESITLKQGVNLQGESRESTIIDGQSQYRDVILVQGDNLIEGLTVTGGAAYNGGPTSAVRIEGNNVRLTGNSVINNGGYGVYLRAGSNIVIERSFFKDNNLAIQHPHGSVTGVVIQYNTMVNNNIAINILDGVTPRIENNIITNSAFCAIYEFNWNAYASGQSSRGFATVANNTFFSNAWHPTYYGSSTPPAVEALTTGNIQADPQFNDPASGDYSVSGTSAAFGRGAFLPAGLNAALDRVSMIDADYSIMTITENDVVIGYRALYEEGSVEEFYNDGRQVLDTTPPAIVFLSGVLTNQVAYTLRYTADGVEHVEIRTLVENANTLKVSAADIFGNQSEESLDVMLDQTSPVVAQAGRDFEYFGIVSNPFPVSSDMFGQELVSANDNLLIGIGRKDKAGLTDAGAVYLLDGNPDSLNFGKSMIELINPTPATNDYFGTQVAAFGDKLYVSATGDDRSGTDTGSVYMYNGNPLHYAFGSLLYTFSNPRPSANDYFGCAMAADALTIAIAAVGEDMAGDSAGAVYLFDNDSASATFGSLLYTFVSPSPESYGYFGDSVYKNGNYLFIGATSEDHGASNAGTVYMYDANPTSPEFGQLLHIFTDPTPNRNGYFGREIKMVGKNVLIGQDISTLETPEGEAYLFDADPVSPTFGEIQAVFKTPDTFKDAGYGRSMAVLGTKIVIGSRSAGRTPTSIGWGKVFVYEADPLNERFGDLLQTIEAADYVDGDYFGNTVTAVRNRLFVSAIFKHANGISDVGQIYAYEDFSAFPAVVINAGDSYAYSKNIKLSLNVEDNFTGQNNLQMAFSLDGGQTYSLFEPYSGTKNITLSEDLGNKTIIARFRDEAGNFSDFSDTIELRQPVLNGSVTVNSGATYTASKTVTLNLTDLSIGTPIAMVAFSADGVTFAGPVPYAKTISFDLPAGDGPKTVYVKGFNAEGTLSVIFSDMIQLDQTGPTGSVQINNNSGFTNNPNITLNLTASDAISGLDSMRFSLDSGATWTNFEKFAATKSLVVSTPEGVKEVQCQFRDKLGNVSTYASSVILDKTIPTGNFEVNEGVLYTNNISVGVTLTFSDSLSGLDQMQFFTPGSGWTEWENFASSRSVTLFSWLDSQIVRVRVRDRAGNMWDGTKSIILDMNTPTGTVKINNDMIRTNSLAVSLSLVGSDATSGMGKMRFSVDGGYVWSEWENFHSSKTLNFPAGPGTKEVRVQLMDKAGNASSALIADSIIFDPAILSEFVPDQNFESYNGVRKVMLLGSLEDQGGIPLIYSFIAPENLFLNGEFAIYKNQLTYIADEGFVGSGVIKIQALGNNAMIEHNVNLQINPPEINIPGDPQFNQQYGLSLTDAARAWNLSTGSGVVVAVIDSGINIAHPDLDGNIFTNPGEIAGDGIDNDGNGFIDDVHGWDFVNADNNPADDNGHGTHVSGIIAAEAGNGQGGAGIAPDAELLATKALNSWGGGTTMDNAFQKVAQGILYAVQIGAKVINMSLGYLTLGISASVVQAVKDAIAIAQAAGVVVVAAAGNNNGDVSNYIPASLNNVIAVSATDSSDGRATSNGSYFSNYGNAIDLAAPGANVYSTYWTSANPSDYAYMNGTSMASPFVAGLAALIMAQDNSATSADVFRRLKFSSMDLGTIGWDQYYGYGRIDAFQALSYDYYDNGVIKTQWLESPDENGWNRLFFDAEGYFTGGTYVGISGIAGIGGALTKAITPVVQPIAFLLRPSFSRLSEKQFRKFSGVNSWSGGIRGQTLKEERGNDSELKSRLLLPVDQKKNDRTQKVMSNERVRDSSKERSSVREKTQNQKIIHDRDQNELILKSVWSSPLIGTALSLALNTWSAGDM